MLERIKNFFAGKPPKDTSPEDAADQAVARSLWDFREKPSSRLAPMPASLGIWELAWPTILAALMHTVVRWDDIKMVGDLGMEAIAGVTAGGQIYWVVQAVVMALTMGTVALVARAFGANDMSLADRVLRQSILMGTIFGLVSWLAFLPWLTPAIALLGMEDAVVTMGADYTFWLLAGNIPFTLTFVFGAALRAAGDSRTPLYVGVVSNVLNIFLNWVLIYGNLGAPALGVVGAGIASSAAMFVQLVIFLYMWRNSRLIIKPKSLSLKLDFDLWKRILKIGYPASIEGFVFQAGLLAFMGLMATFGTAEFTAYQIGIQVLAMAFLPGHGFATAASTLVGQHLGANRPDLAATAGWRSMVMAIWVMSAMGRVGVST
jgi:putative MATE family efflux protein